MKMEGEYYWNKDDGNERTIHVDKSTKMGKVVVGEMVKAYVTDQGHTASREERRTGLA